MQSLLRSRQQLFNGILAPSQTPYSHPSQHAHQNTTPPPFSFGVPQRADLSVSHSGRMQLLSWSSDKRRERPYLLCVDMTIVWTHRARLTIGLFPSVAQAWTHSSLFVCVCVSVGEHRMPHMLSVDGKLSHKYHNAQFTAANNEAIIMDYLNHKACFMTHV